WHARAAWLALGLASTVLGCSVYDDSLRQGQNVSGGGSNGASAGAEAGGSAGISLGGELIDAGASGDSGEAASGGTSTGGSSTGGSSTGGGGRASGGAGGRASGGTGGVVASGGAAGTATSGGSSGANSTGGAASGASELGVGKPTTASTQQPANASGSGNDGQTATRWSATTAALPQWWRVDLGASYALTQLSVQFEFADRKYTYAVETSADDVSYSTQANVVDGIGAVQVVPMPSNVSARYVRITCTSTVPGIDPSTGASRPTWVSFWEVSVLGS
ncbi:MAG TPA: discoidin domain-containing protein, partial [Polyangiaceae bacterium]